MSFFDEFYADNKSTINSVGGDLLASTLQSFTKTKSSSAPSPTVITTPTLVTAPKDNTMIYVGVGAAVLLVVLIVVLKK